MKIFFSKNNNLNQGFTLLVAIITTSILLLVSFVVINIAAKQLVITYTGQESQQAFYAADSGIECAYFWDVKNYLDPGRSAFSTSTSGRILCNDQDIITASQQNIPTNPPQMSRIGGPEAHSIFYLTFDNNSCAIVTVEKISDGTTIIRSRGYNTCDPNASRRFERGTELIY